jgi:hypothetical protein
VREHRLLLLGIHPVEEVDGLSGRIVITGDLFAEEDDEEFLEIEILREQAEFLENEFGAAEALGIVVFGEVLFDVGGDGVTIDEATLDHGLNGQVGVFAGEFEDVVDGAEEGVGLFGGDFLFGGGRLDGSGSLGGGRECDDGGEAEVEEGARAGHKFRGVSLEKGYTEEEFGDRRESSPQRLKPLAFFHHGAALKCCVRPIG